MIPEFYEVFELYEFQYILKAFDTLKSAVKDFGRSGGAAAVPAQPKQDTVSTDTKKQELVEPNETAAGVQSQTLEDKIRQIIKTMPEAGTRQLSRKLNTPEFGNEKIGWFGLRRTLKRLGLESKQKRFAYARQSR